MECRHGPASQGGEEGRGTRQVRGEVIDYYEAWIATSRANSMVFINGLIVCVHVLTWKAVAATSYAMLPPVYRAMLILIFSLLLWICYRPSYLLCTQH